MKFYLNIYYFKMSKKTTVFRVSENFSLRKIDPNLIALNFFKGEYLNRKISEKKIKKGNILKIGKDVGNDMSSEVYRFKDKDNNNQTIYTTNHALYNYVTKKNEGKILENPILKCKYCKRGNLKSPIGLPISMEIDNENVKFLVIDSFCDFGCTFSYLKRKNTESRLYRGPIYTNAEQLLYSLYYRVYPDRVGKNIKDKPDWELLRENGGPLTDEEFDSEKADYFPIPSVTVSSTKKQYIKLNV